jgi:hypothetical protein
MISLRGETFALLFLGLSLALTGCAADSDGSAPIHDDGETAEADVVSIHHYQAKDVSVHWKPGCGVRPPDDQTNTCQKGLFITFTRKYADLDFKQTVTVDNEAHTIEIKLDTFSRYSAHVDLLVAPQTERVQGNFGFGTYQVKVVDYRNRELHSSEVDMFPAA